MLLRYSLFLSLLQTAFCAYTWNFTNQPRQCQNLTVSISGSGSPPYRILIIPFGATPLPNNVEARTIVNVPFDGTSANFQLKYPANSQFVAVVSDASGFGSGGTSVAAQVLTSDDASCFNASADVAPLWSFSIEPPNQIVQCQATRIWWDKGSPQGTPTFVAVIPGGQSFTVPEGSITDVASQGTGFSWTPSVRGGNTIMLVGGDDRSPGSGGSVLNTVSPGPAPNSNCLNSNSPSSTPGSPAGGAYPTSSDGAGTGGGGSNSGGGGTNGSGSGSGHGGSSNVGAIVGGVLGGIVAFIAFLLFLLFLRRRNRVHASKKERPLDLLHGEDIGDERGSTGHELPPNYHPEPFMVPDPTLASSSNNGHSIDGGRPMSMSTSTGEQQFGPSAYRSPTPDALGGGSTATRKSAATSQARNFRAVNIVQHDDAGPPQPAAGEGSEEPETIELPPAYTNLKKPGAPPSTVAEGSEPGAGTTSGHGGSP